MPPGKPQTVVDLYKGILSVILKKSYQVIKRHVGNLHIAKRKKPVWKVRYCMIPPNNVLEKVHGERLVVFMKRVKRSVQFSSVQSLSRVRLFVTPWIAARQASRSITNSRSSLRLTSIESVMPSSHLILHRPLLLLPPIPPSIRVFSNESTLCMRWPKY